MKAFVIVVVVLVAYFVLRPLLLKHADRSGADGTNVARAGDGGDVGIDVD